MYFKARVAQSLEVEQTKQAPKLRNDETDDVMKC